MMARQEAAGADKGEDGPSGGSGGGQVAGRVVRRKKDRRLHNFLPVRTSGAEFAVTGDALLEAGVLWNVD